MKETNRPTLLDSHAHNAFFIKAYYVKLQKRIKFLAELNDKGWDNEALLLCCCYIEALGSRESAQPKSKAKNYCSILAERGDNEIWRQIHPQQLKNILSENKEFSGNLSTLLRTINSFGSELIEQEQVLASLSPCLNAHLQRSLQGIIYKGSMAYISYDRIRNELVHDLSASSSISFSGITYKGNPVPNLEFELLYKSLCAIANAIQIESESTNKWWYEQ